MIQIILLIIFVLENVDKIRANLVVANVQPCKPYKVLGSLSIECLIGENSNMRPNQENSNNSLKGNNFPKHGWRGHHYHPNQNSSPNQTPNNLLDILVLKKTCWKAS